jgi:hypothetical protein
MTDKPRPLKLHELTAMAFAVSGLSDALRFALNRERLSVAQLRTLALISLKPVIATQIAGWLASHPGASPQ